MWFAIKSSNREKISQILHIKNLEPGNWENGKEKAYLGSIFISPVIDGWTLMCGLGVPPSDSSQEIEKIKKILETLSRGFGEAQFFCTHHVVEYHCWM